MSHRNRERYETRGRSDRESRRHHRYGNDDDEDSPRHHRGSSRRHRDDDYDDEPHRTRRRNEYPRYKSGKSDYDNYDPYKVDRRDPSPDKDGFVYPEGAKERRGLLNSREEKWFDKTWNKDVKEPFVSGKLVYAEGATIFVTVGVEKDKKKFMATIIQRDEDGFWVKFEAGPFGNKFHIIDNDGVIPPNFAMKIAENQADANVFGKPSFLKMLLCLKPSVLGINQAPELRPDWWVTGGWLVVIGVIVLIMISS